MAEMPFMSPPDFEGGVQGPPLPIGSGAQPWNTPGHWFVFRGDQLLVEIGPPNADPPDDARIAARPTWARLPLQKSNTDHNILGVEGARTLFLGRLEGVPCWAAAVSADTPPPAGTSWASLRALFSVLADAHFALAGRAMQLLDWDRSHQFCGRCGTRTEAKTDERARLCPACKLPAYPRIAPAVMALVRRGRALLLGRGPHFPSGMYSALAGFVEPGETLEQCVAREVEEEVGVRVSRIRYFASQPWPFPHSLMIAFVCEWKSGEIKPQAGEIEDANWFEVLQLPKLPSKISIARRLIDAVACEIGREIETGA